MFFKSLKSFRETVDIIFSHQNILIFIDIDVYKRQDLEYVIEHYGNGNRFFEDEER